MTPTICRTCRFFLARTAEDGECRGGFPTPVYVESIVRPGVWPTVRVDAWCGQHRPAAEETR